MYNNFVEYEDELNAAGPSLRVEEKSFFEKNKKALLISGAVLLIILLITPDMYIRKYVPWVK